MSLRGNCPFFLINWMVRMRMEDQTSMFWVFPDVLFYLREENAWKSLARSMSE